MNVWTYTEFYGVVGVGRGCWFNSGRPSSTSFDYGCLCWVRSGRISSVSLWFIVIAMIGIMQSGSEMIQHSCQLIGCFQSTLLTGIYWKHWITCYRQITPELTSKSNQNGINQNNNNNNNNFWNWLANQIKTELSGQSNEN